MKTEIAEKQCEVTILMPCLNEAETLESCIRKAQGFLKRYQITGEILIADNGSTDASVEIAERCGARVIHVLETGYGAALIGGCNAAYGKYVIMGDADDSYDFSDLMPFLDKLRSGYELVMGNRFEGGIEKGAMPMLHRYIGNPVLSFIGRLLYGCPIKDFHCGLRAYNKYAIQKLGLRTTGMEYASEMVVQARLHHLNITEVPTTLVKDGRTRPPHLRSWRDGWRHLKFLLMYSPNWLFLYPGMLCVLIGLILMTVLEFGPLVINEISFDIHTLLYAAALILVGVNTIWFAIFTKSYATRMDLIPMDRSMRILEKLTLEKGVLFGLALIFCGIAATIAAILIWKNTSYGTLRPGQIMRISIPAFTLIVVGVESVFSGFFIGILEIEM